MTKKNQLANDIYDLIRYCALPKNKSKFTDWNKLTLKHANEAKANFRKLMRNKTIEVSNGTVTIGKKIKITINT